MLVRKLFIGFPLLLISLSIFAQQKGPDFNRDWKEIDSLIQRGLTKTALSTLDAVAQIATKKGDAVQGLKVMTYRLFLEEQVTENTITQQIISLDSARKWAKDSSIIALYHSLIAKTYLQYFNDHRWQLYDRKNVSEKKSTEIQAWSANDFQQSIIAHYKASLQPEKLLQQTLLNDYEPLIQKGNSRKLRPTLYDLLAHEALNYFKTQEGRLPKSINPFSIADPEMLTGYRNFIQLPFTTTDTGSHALISLQIFQQLIRFHVNDLAKDALIDVDLERMEWVKSMGAFTNLEEKYLKALYAIADEFTISETSSKAWLLIAKHLTNNAEAYPYLQTNKKQSSNIEAKRLIEYSLNKYSNKQPAYDELNALLKRILKVSLQTETEKINTPNKPFRLLLRFKNMDTVYFRILNASQYPALSEQYTNNDVIGAACASKPIKSTYQILPTTADYLEHRVEIKMDGLPSGNYILLSSPDKEFRSSSFPVSFLKFQNTSISYIRKDKDLFVLNRESGIPLKHTTVTILTPVNQYAWNSNWTTVASGKTDENGYYKIASFSKNTTYRFSFETEKDSFQTLENEYLDARKTLEIDSLKFEKDNQQTFFFTDRSIYRPGQFVFFKGIAVTKDFITRQSKIIPSYNGKVYLKDANRMIIDSMYYSTNEYGSFSGKFLLPEKGLSGNFSIERNKGERGNANFSVEQYKRPTFQVQFEKNTGSWRLYDSIFIKGNTKAYAGNALNNATLVYHVMRNSRPSYPSTRSYPFRYSAPGEIAFGTSETDSAGNFTIRFRAIPDDGIDSISNPLYDFSVEATITDGNGESRVGRTNITCGYQSILLNVNCATILPVDSSISISIRTTNLANEPLETMVKVQIKSLTHPNRFFRKRYWEKPDLYLMDKLVYWKYFPTDEYENETDFTTWPKASIVYSSEAVSTASKKYNIPAGLLKSGAYVIQTSVIDTNGKMVEAENYLQVFGNENSSNSLSNIVLNYQETKVLEPGQSITLNSLLMSKEAYLIHQIIRPSSVEPYQIQVQKQGLHQTVLTATDVDRGGIGYEETFVYNNRIYQKQFKIEVPWLSKALQINYSSYRNKTAPGSQETWAVEIAGNKGQKMVTELITSMYDASLDAFKNHQWYFPNLWIINNYQESWNGFTNFYHKQGQQNYFNEKFQQTNGYTYDALNLDISHRFGYLGRPGMMLNESVIVGNGNAKAYDVRIRGLASSQAKEIPTQEEDYNKVYTKVDVYDEKTGEHIVNGRVVNKPNISSQEAPVIRKNFSETAFFFPQLLADSNGVYKFSFTMPDAVTKWKWQSFAHSKDLATGLQSADILTQKTLMVQTNAPRFMREGDKMEFSTRIANMSEKELTGQVTLELIDPSTNTSIDGWFQNVFPSQFFTVAAGQTTTVKFPIQIAFSYNRPLTWRVVARSGNYSDGEENVLPVLSNRQLVTETMPLHTIGDTTMHLKFEKLLHQNSSSATNESLTVEFSTNPTWYAIKALPYLQEGNENCVEVVFSRFYSNALASYIINKYPVIKQYYQAWKKDSVTLLSTLQKNESLKQVLLNETPWVIAAKTEAEQMQQLSELFNLVRLSEDMDVQIKKLLELQLPNGGFSWFKGGYSNQFMTSMIVTGIGKLKRLGAITPDIAIRLKPMILSALSFLDAHANEQYKITLRQTDPLNHQNIGLWEVQYLYMRSFFGDISNATPDAWDFYMKQGRKYWTKLSIEDKAKLVLVYNRNKEYALAYDKIIPAIMENSVYSRDKGIYWKINRGYSWRGSQMATQLMVTIMAGEMVEGKKAEVLRDQLSAMKTWLLLHKETNHWGNSLATADACYALLMQGDNWLSEHRTVQIQLDKTIINSATEKSAAGTGYFQKRIEGSKVDPIMGNISITTSSKKTNEKISSTNKSYAPAWGAIYWQYFEEMDKISSAESPLKIKKQLMVEKNSNSGKILVPINTETQLHVGDKLVIRLEITADRDMEYIHLKDARAAGMEPQNVLSGYKWQDGLGYYESTSDASTNFFFDRMAKGVYVFEYPVVLTHLGDFSTGIASLQCLYAPGFSSHSEGFRIQVVD